MAFEGAREDGGVEGVGETVAEHHAQLGISDARAYTRDGGFDGGTGEAALAGCGTLVQIRWLDLGIDAARRGSRRSGN